MKSAKFSEDDYPFLTNIPQHWSIVPFRRLFSESSEVNGKLPVGPMLSISGHRGVEVKSYDSENRRRTPEEVSDYRVVRPGQLAVNTMWMNHGGLGVSDLSGHMSPAYRAYNISRALLPRYAHHLLRSPGWVSGYTARVTGIRPNSLQLTRHDLMSFPVLVPPKSEQLAIADYLDHETAEIDTFIADLEELLSITERRKWAVIDQAYLNAASLAEHVRLRHLATLNPSAPRSYVQSDAPFRLLPMEAIHEFGPPSDGVAKTYDELKTGYSYIGTSDVAFAKVTPCFENGKGLTGYDLREPVFATTEVTVVRPDSEVDQRYLALMLQTEAFRGPAIASMTGAGGLKRVPDEYVRNFRLPLPSVSEQVRMVRDVDSELTNLGRIQKDVKNAVTLSKERRAALISAAVTGQIDITQKHRPVAEQLEDEVKQQS